MHCKLRADCVLAISENHNKHFAWCSRYDRATPWISAGDFFREAAKEMLTFEVVGTLKKLLALYGASTTGLKHELIDRLKPLMDVPAPEVGPGSWYHFNKDETIAALKEFCRKNQIMIKSRYGKKCIAHTKPYTMPHTMPHIRPCHIPCYSPCHTQSHHHSDSKLDLYELVYFRRPKDPDKTDTTGGDGKFSPPTMHTYISAPTHPITESLTLYTHTHAHPQLW